jgi:lysophospholipase
MKNTAAHGYVPVPNYLSDSLEGMSRFHDPKGLAQVMHGQLSRRSSLEDGVPQSMASSSSSKGSSFPRMPQDEESRSGERRKMKWLITPPSLYGKRIRYAILEYDPLLDSSNMNMNGKWMRR